eukprot:748225-Hanusia_phi.AAC.1
MGRPGTHKQRVSSGAEAPQLLLRRPAVTDRHRRVCLEQSESKRSAQLAGTTNDHGEAAGDGGHGAGPQEQLHDSLYRAGKNEGRWQRPWHSGRVTHNFVLSAEGEVKPELEGRLVDPLRAQGDAVLVRPREEAFCIDVLACSDYTSQELGVELGRQGALQEDSVYLIFPVERHEGIVDLPEACRGRKLHLPCRDPHRVAQSDLVKPRLLPPRKELQACTVSFLSSLRWQQREHAPLLASSS